VQSQWASERVAKLAVTLTALSRSYERDIARQSGSELRRAAEPGKQNRGNQESRHFLNPAPHDKIDPT
jgi:hypothetical protein